MECAVRPLGRVNAAFPVDAKHRTRLALARNPAVMAGIVDVFPETAGASIMNDVPPVPDDTVPVTASKTAHFSVLHSFEE